MYIHCIIGIHKVMNTFASKGMNYWQHNKCLDVYIISYYIILIIIDNLKTIDKIKLSILFSLWYYKEL